MKTLLALIVVALAPILTSIAQETQPERELTKFESSILGKWYFGGDKTKVCYIVNAGSILFAINEVQATLQMSVVKEGTLRGYRSDYAAYAKIDGESLLWSNGYWWSRKPITWEPAN